MSEDTKDKETAEAVTGESVSDEAGDEEAQAESPPAEEQDKAPPKPAAKASRVTSPVAWLALFLALLTLAAVGYMIVEDRRTRALEESSTDTLERLAGRIDEAQASLSDLDEDLEDLVSGGATLESRIDELQKELESRADILESLPGRMSNLENSVAALQGASAGARDTWLLAEAEYYMQLANAQLQLGNNPRLAMLALGMADERVVQLADPGLTGVRRALAGELAALEAMEKPDLEGTTLTLASLARVVDTLPLRTPGSEAGESGGAADGEQGAAARAWDSVRDAMSGLVKVTPPDEETRALLTPDAAHLIRSNVALQLQAARLALLRGEQAIFEQSLEDADALLSEYFDGDSAPVKSAMATIAEIRESMVTVAVPDISESLRLIRQFRVLSENDQ